MKKYNIVILLLLIIGFSACDKELLNLESLTEPVQSNL